MSWVFWLIGYLLLLAVVLLFFAGVSSSERFDDEQSRQGKPQRVRPPKAHPSETGQLELTLDRNDQAAVGTPPSG